MRDYKELIKYLGSVDIGEEGDEGHEEGDPTVRKIHQRPELSQAPKKYILNILSTQDETYIYIRFANSFSAHIHNLGKPLKYINFSIVF